jgi:D-alanyl-D-alanine carboxypeptidase
VIRRLGIKRPLVAIVACSMIIGASAAPAIASSHEDAGATLDSALAKLVKANGGPPGVTVVVQQGDDVKLHTAGVADIETSAAPQLDDHIRIASVAKAFSGAAAVALVKEGVLSLDDTVGKWRPDLPASMSKVTIAQLLHHTSGIPDFSDTKAFKKAIAASLLQAPPPSALVDYIADDALEFNPGSRYKYSNTDNIVVALIIKAATNQSYDAVLESRVYAPLGLTGTSLPPDENIPTPYIHGYSSQTKGTREDLTTIVSARWAWASGGVVSTPADTNRFVRGYASGALTDPATHTAQLQFVKGTSEPPGPGKNSAGLAIFRYDTKCGEVYGHTGNIFGYTEFLASTADGTRSATVNINAQITRKSDAKVFKQLRNVFELAVCAATEGT